MSKSARVCPDAYEVALCRFCRQSALFEHFSECQEAGLKIPEREIKRAMQLCEEAKEDLLIEKQNLGWDDEIDFCKKPLYSNKGFELVNRRLTGKISEVVPTLESWRTVDKVTAKNHFKYEQATLALSHYYVKTGQYPMRGAWKIRLRQKLVKLILWKKGADQFLQEKFGRKNKMEGDAAE